MPSERTLFAQRRCIVVNVESTFVSCLAEAPAPAHMSKDSPPAFQTLLQMTDGFRDILGSQLTAWIPQSSPAPSPRNHTHKKAKSNSVSCQQPRCLANKNLGNMGEENMIVTLLAPRDITHTTVTVKVERSQRRELTGGAFSINQSDLLINSKGFLSLASGKKH